MPASDARQRVILEAALDGVISIDGQARITYVNSAAERIFGYRADEMIGREMAEVMVPPSLREEHRAGFHRYLATGEAHVLDRRIEITAMRADGNARASSARVTVAADGDRCTVEVRDDGIGGACARSDASGLVGLRDRIGALGGGMDIVSPADGGTVLRAWVPLQRDPAA